MPFMSNKNLPRTRPLFFSCNIIEDTRNFLIKRIEKLRAFHEGRMAEVFEIINRVEENIDDAKAKIAFNTFLNSISAWIRQHK